MSIAEYRLGVFLELIDLYSLNKQDFYELYVENLFSASRYDPDYKQNKQTNKNSSINNYIYENPYIQEYRNINTRIYYEIKISEIDKQILNLNTDIQIIKERLSLLNLDSNLSSIDDLKKQINYINKKDREGKSTKHKAVLTGKIHKYRLEIKELENKEKEKFVNISNLEQKLNSKLNELNKFKEDKETILKLNNLNNEKINLLKNKNGLKNTSLESNSNLLLNIDKLGKRQYHSFNYNQKRFVSTQISTRKLEFNIDSPVYLELQRIINNSELDNNTQIKIEKFLNDQGSLLLENRIDQILDVNYYKLNPYILDFLKKSIEDLKKLINNYRENLNLLANKKSKDFNNKGKHQILLSVSDDIIISNLLGRFLRIISNNNLTNKNTICVEVARDLATSLLYSYYTNELKNRNTLNNLNFNNLSLNNFIKDNYKEFIKFESDYLLISLGFELLYFLEEVNLIKSITLTLSKDQKQSIYITTKEISENIGKYSNLLDISYKIPMLVKPKKYGRDLKTGKDILGGFLLNDKEFVSPLIIKNSELKQQSVINTNNNIFDLVNNISSVAYKINTQVLDFIFEKGLDFDLFIDPNFIHPLQIKKEKGNKLTLLETKKLASFLSRKQLEMNILGLALIFKNVSEFFIPVRLDNRGRLYCMVDYLNYQSIELAKALLLFSKGEKIYKSDKKSIDYLKIFGANCFGNGIDKKSYLDRVEWVNNNEINILNFRNGELLTKADSKLLFIAFCFEYINYKNSLNFNDTYYISHFPIQLDATCNGYQHLSLLTGDEPLSGQLNLISDDENTIPKDFYTFVGMKLKEYLNNKIIEIKNSSKNLEDLPSYEKLIKLNIHRKLVKVPIMVKPYNASLFQMVNYIKEQFDEV